MEDLGITVAISADDADFDNKVSAVNKEITALKQSANRLKKELKLDPSNIDTMRKRVGELSKALEKAKVVYKAWNDMRDKQLAEGATVKELAETEKQINKAHDRVLSLEIALEQANATLEEATSNSVKFSEAMSTASKFAGNLADKLEPISKEAQNFLKGAVDNAIDFEDAFAEVKKTVASTGHLYSDELMFGGLKQDVRDLALELPKTASGIAKVMGLAGQMNVPAEQLKDFTEAMIKFGDSTNITAEEAVTDIAQIYNVIGKGGDFSDLNNLLSAIVELGNNSATTEKDITTMFKNISAGASRVKMTESQMVALSATLSSLGLDKGGASAISNIMTKIDKAVTASGADMQEWAKVAGMSGEAFKKAWSEDSADALLQIVTSMSKMTDEGISMNSIFADLDIKELRQIDTLSRLVNAHDEYAKNIELANSAYEKGSALSEEASKRYETLKSQIQILTNNFAEFALTIGDLLLPFVRDIIDSIGELADWLNALSPEAKKAIAQIIAIVAVASPLLRVLSVILGVLGNLSTWIGNVTSAISFLASGVVDLVSKLAIFIFTHGTLIAVIGAVIAIVILLYNKWEWFRNLVDKLIQKIKDLWNQFKQTNWIETLGEKFGLLGYFIGGVIEVVKQLFNWFGRLIEIAMAFIGISGSVNSFAMAHQSGSMGGGMNVINTGGFGALNSGGFNSGGITLNANFSVNSNNITRSDVHSWAEWMADDINYILGRKIR